MDKYAGLNKVDAKVQKNDEVRTQRHRRGVPLFFKQLALAGGCALVLFGCSFFGKLKRVTSTVKEAVSFDAVAYVRDLTEREE